MLITGSRCWCCCHFTLNPRACKMWQHSNSKDNSTSGVLLTTPMAPKQASGPLVHDQGVDGDGLPGWVLTPLPFVQAQREAIVRCFCCVKPVRLQVAWVTSGKLKFYAVSAVMWHRSQNQPRQCKVTEVGFIKKYISEGTGTAEKQIVIYTLINHTMWMISIC